ncbi:MAG: DNA sulfur modification protein DndD [Candidatus Thiodiazotropha sp.]
MILESLRINNFRVFYGEHTFDLAPRVKYNKKRPIILFGGLNGAGKTTTLTAVRLALYGRQSLGHGISKKDYDEYLTKSIHRANDKHSDKPTYADVQLTFSYASFGIVKHYTVVRSWKIKGEKKNVSESLTIEEDGKQLQELNTDQCQGFLNELVPIGVSDLFFFDGEKIAELAEDTKGDALGDSIKKLLGLDIIDTLNADLGIFLRNEEKKGSSKTLKKEITELENQLKVHEQEAHQALEQFNQSLTAEKALMIEIEKLENQLSSRGGAWAATREEAVKKQATHQEEKRIIDESIRETLSGSYPFAIASDYAKKTIEQLRNERAYKIQHDASHTLQESMKSLRNSLESILDKTNLHKVDQKIQHELKRHAKSITTTNVIHDISDTLLSVIEATINDAITNQQARLDELHQRLCEVNNELDKAGKNIARAPTEAQIKPTVDAISSAHQKCSDCRSSQKIQIQLHKQHLREAITTARQLEKLTFTISSDEEKTRTIHYAAGAKGLLKDFANEIAKRKVKDLETEFVNSFYRLARKEDINLTASIDPKTFSVTLLSDKGREVNKDELSAGEKQIYAISLLEALARTSGRRLPIIIDTPLGRLDSVHRANLINNYFPYASHQVIILSTDTEVDEDFYKDLSPSISHAFKLDYDPKNGSTQASEEYFWRVKRVKAR